MINEGGGGQQKVTSFYRGGHQKVTLGDMGGGRGQKSQKRGDVLCERPLRQNTVAPNVKNLFTS